MSKLCCEPSSIHFVFHIAYIRGLSSTSFDLLSTCICNRLLIESRPGYYSHVYALIRIDIHTCHGITFGSHYQARMLVFLILSCLRFHVKSLHEVLVLGNAHSIRDVQPITSPAGVHCRERPRSGPTSQISTISQSSCASAC